MKIRVSSKSGKNTLYEGVFAFMTISRSIRLRMRNVLDKIVEKNKTHLLCSVIFFPENRTVYEILSKSLVEPEAADDMAPTRFILDT